MLSHTVSLESSKQKQENAVKNRSNELRHDDDDVFTYSSLWVMLFSHFISPTSANNAWWVRGVFGLTQAKQ
jgi:hypothetical protein